MKKLQRKNSIANRVQALNYSTIRKNFGAGRVPGIIDLTIGQPDFDVPDDVKTQAAHFIDAGRNKYTETKGVAELRSATSAYLKRTRGVIRGADEIIITAGTTAGIFLVLLTLINEGDEIIIFEPYFIAYVEIAKLVGGKVVLVKTDKNFYPDMRSLKNSVTKKTKVIIINSPCNPTGAVYPRKCIGDIVALAKKFDVFVISDEVYSSFIYDEPFFSPAQIYKKTILIDGPSKSLGMTGWRIGFVAGPKKIIDAVEKSQQFTSVCAPSALQYATIAALQKGLSQEILSRYKNTRDKLYAGISNMYETIRPGGAFYFFMKTPVPGEDFAKKLLTKKGIAVVPGSAFGRSRNYVRISYAISPDKVDAIINSLTSIFKNL